MTRIELTPELERMIADARRDIDELKNRQFAGGDNLKIVSNQTSNQTDATLSMPPSGTGEVVVTFDADYQERPFTELYVLVGTSPDILTPDTNFPYTTQVRQHIHDEALPKRTVWSVYFTSLSGTFYFKFQVKATDTGTIS